MKRILFILFTLLPVALWAQDNPISITGSTTNSNVTLQSKGTGSITLQTVGAGAISLKTTATERLAIAAGGAVSIPGSLAVTGAVTATGGVTMAYPATTYEAVTAAGTNYGDCGAGAKMAAGKFIHYVAGSDETTVAALPACATANIGETHLVMNGVANKFLKLVPITGSTINGGASWSNGAAGQGGKTTVCYCQANTAWICG